MRPGPEDFPQAAATAVALEVVVEHAPAVVATYAADGTVLQVSGDLVETMSLRPAELVGRHFADTIDDGRITAGIAQALTGTPVRLEMRLNDRAWTMDVRPLVTDRGVAGAVSVFSLSDERGLVRVLQERQAELEKFAALVELSGDFISMTDLDGTVTYLNRAGRALVGLASVEDAVGRPAADFVSERVRAAYQQIRQGARDQRAWRGELRHFGTGEAIPVSVNSFLVASGSSGEPIALATVQRDLRGWLGVEQNLAKRLREQRWLTELGRLALTEPLDALLTAAIRFIELGTPGTVCSVMRRSEDAGHLVVAATTTAVLAGAHVPVDPTSMAARAMDEDHTFWSEDIAHDDRFPDRSGDPRLHSSLSAPIPGPAGAWGVVSCASSEARAWSEEDVSFLETVAATLGAAVRRHELETRLQHQALHDPLTGLPNRSLVSDRIEQALARAERDGAMVAVFLLDLDDFKVVNDSLGHASGDDLLTEVATRLAAAVPSTDTIARIGGDEFVVVCEELSDERDVAAVAEALLRACTQGVDVAGRRLELSASIGVTVARSTQTTSSTLLSEADIAMHLAKRDRPGSYRVFDRTMRGDVVGRLNLAGELRAAIRTGQIDVAFQPIVDVRTGRVVAMEALARWTSAQGGSIPPDAFIPLAEETGLIGDLGHAVLRRAAGHATQWQEHGRVELRVNSSAHELRSHQYAERVLSALHEVGLPPDLLGLEITESVLVDDDRVTAQTLTSLRAAGVSLLVDDFGTGYSSMGYLQRFPVVDVLKIDRTFLDSGVSGKAVIEAIIALGRAFGALVCAEGVETREQYSLVSELGCHLAQGYLLSRPVPAGEASELLAGWTPVTPDL